MSDVLEDFSVDSQVLILHFLEHFEGLLGVEQELMVLFDVALI